MKYFLKISFLILTLISISCSSSKSDRFQNKIIVIGESKVCGDKGGRFHHTRINKDSTITISGTRWNKNLNDTLKFKTGEYDWKKLTKILNVNDFIKLKSGVIGNLYADGCTKSVYIQTKDSTFSKPGLGFYKSIQEAKTINDLIR